ncbi:DUF453-domain-containing protein [Trichodelitschia bisporula]|uniref:DUF453-domain-containing protein n=1 Tax=Trichodelitschia bisporula TaxID=703511 RepID=A0A6G1HW57_9PEZI|nr:DUF453-domain-containing protein [Trichodelitschia bisporula]
MAGSQQTLTSLLRQTHLAHRRALTSSGSPHPHTPVPTPVTYYRGGTSRALIFHPTDLPRTPSLRSTLLLQAIGAPDPYSRQLNGLGAGVSSLSKACLVSRSQNDPDADVDYTFIGLGIEKPEVDYAGNCGNMSAAIGPYAWEQGLLPSTAYKEEGQVTVRIRQTNTGTLIHAHFPVARGQPVVDASTRIDGVSGLGTPVRLDFLQPGGAKTGRLLPTGRAVDELLGLRASIVDAANPCVFVRAQDIGIRSTAPPGDIMSQPGVMARLEALRTAGAVAMGLVKEGAQVPRVVPKIALIGPRAEQIVLGGAVVRAGDVDLVREEGGRRPLWLRHL